MLRLELASQIGEWAITVSRLRLGWGGALRELRAAQLREQRSPRAETVSTSAGARCSDWEDAFEGRTAGRYLLFPSWRFDDSRLTRPTLHSSGEGRDGRRLLGLECSSSAFSRLRTPRAKRVRAKRDVWCCSPRSRSCRFDSPRVGSTRRKHSNRCISLRAGAAKGLGTAPIRAGGPGQRWPENSAIDREDDSLCGLALRVRIPTATLHESLHAVSDRVAGRERSRLARNPS